MKTLKDARISLQVRFVNLSKLKKLVLIGVLISYAHLGIAQTICIDTLNWPFVGNDTLYRNVFGWQGYASGHNISPQPSTAGRIGNSETISVIGALIWFGHAETTDSTSIVTVTLWDSTGTNYDGSTSAPGNILTTKDILITDIVNDVSGGMLTEVYFDSSITLTEDFYLGIQVYNAPGDSVGIITNTDGDPVITPAWAEYPDTTAFAGWWNFPDSWFLDVSLAVFPIRSTTINASFNASADTVDLAVSGTVIFTNTSAGAMSWYWWFGDGDTSTSMSPTHTYDSVGTYTVTLVASLGSCTDTAWTIINVICPVFSAGFTQSADSIDVSSPVTFTDTTTGATSWYWWFGDGDTSTAMSPNHTYDSVGTYTVTLVASLGSCTDTAWATINVICPVFSAGFTQSAGSIDVSSSVTFTDTTTGATSWYWWFGDGDTSTVMNPNHTYNSIGSFNIQLVAWIGSCSSDTAWSTIIVNDTTTSINELTLPGTFSIFPNPTKGVINITFNAHELQPTSIKVYDLKGGLISETNYDLMRGYCTIDLSKQAGGTYLVQIVTRDGVISQKVSLLE